MNRREYFREYHARNRDKRRAQMMARYLALGGHMGRKIRQSGGSDKDTAA